MAVTDIRPPSRRSIDYAEWAITLVLLGVMAGAFLLTLQWPSHTAFFPQIVSGASLVFIAFKLLLMLRRPLAASPPAPMPAPPSKTLATAADAKEDKQITLLAEGDEDQGDEDELHNVFASANRATWLAVIGWLCLFFAGMYLVGLLVILPIFTVLYLRIVARSSWRICLLYVLGTAGVIYLLFDRFLHLPLPQGIVFGG